MSATELIRVKLAETENYSIGSDGHVYNGVNKQVTQYWNPDKELIFIKAGKTKSIIELTEALVKQHFAKSYVEANKVEAAPRGSGAKNKPLVAFKVNGSFVGEYQTQTDFSRAVQFEVMNNVMPPVLKGRVRHCKGYHLFYLSEYSDWLTQRTDAKYEDFPTELHFYYGYKLGESKRTMPNQSTVDAQPHAEATA